MRGDHMANVARIADALVEEACRQMSDGVGYIETDGGTAFVTIDGEIDFERLAEVAIRECRQFRPA